MVHRFLICHQLLSKWQNELEYCLYNFCKITAPQLVGECDWYCAEAAELTRLTEKLTEHFCFRHKRFLSNHGISEQERETFCVRLQEVRQVRNFAVHRVTLHENTIQKYARIVQVILGFLKRIGGAEFLSLCNDRVSKPSESALVKQVITQLKMNQFIETFWDTENKESRDTEVLTSAERNVEPHSIQDKETMSRREQKRVNIEQAIEKQKLAAQRKAINVSRMAEEFQISQRLRKMCICRNEQNKKALELQKEQRSKKARKQKEVAELRKAERIKKSRKQQEDAELRKAGRIEKARRQQEDARLRRAERAEKARKQQEDAELRKAERAEKARK